MKIETFEKAEDLLTTVNSLEKIIEEVEKKHHWIRITTPERNNEWFGIDFQKSLLEFAKMKLKEYEKEFDELQDLDTHCDWISVNDELPKDADYVLIQDYDGEIYMAWFGDNEWVVVSGIYDRFEFEEIPYWQPLPKPKQQERNP